MASTASGRGESIAWHISESLSRSYSGIALKDESASGRLEAPG